MLIWITGLSGAGKTTLANSLKEDLTSLGKKPILLDGDELREALGDLGKGYSIEERKKLAFAYAKLAHYLAAQGNIVIVATISMFEDVRIWNRQNNKNYCEVYLKVSEAVRQQRDPKKLYASGAQVVEFEKGFEEPKKPDFVFDDTKSLEEMVKNINQYIRSDL